MAEAEARRSWSGQGADVLVAGPGRFHSLHGEEGSDRILGDDDGQDFATPGSGADVVHLAGGKDSVNLEADGQVDVIDCGAGNDQVDYFGAAIEPNDTLISCETITFIELSRIKPQ